MRLAWRRLGTPNAAGDDAAVVMTMRAAQDGGAEALAGGPRGIDLDRHCLVLAILDSNGL